MKFICQLVQCCMTIYIVSNVDCIAKHIFFVYMNCLQNFSYTRLEESYNSLILAVGAKTGLRVQFIGVFQLRQCRDGGPAKLPPLSVFLLVKTPSNFQAYPALQSPASLSQTESPGRGFRLTMSRESIKVAVPVATDQLRDA